jgi:hypothetical protein
VTPKDRREGDRESKHGGRLVFLRGAVQEVLY